MLKWDASWYIRIATNWYHYDPTPAAGPGQSAVAFFPLYPGLVRLFNLAIFGSATTLPTSALIVANLAAVVGIAMVYRLVLREFGAALAKRTVWYFVVFPVSFYLSAAYAEPVFLAAAVMAIYAARAGHWWLAGVAGAAATLTRPYGALIALPIAFEYIRQRNYSPREIFGTGAIGVLLPGIALLGWMGYLYGETGDPLAFIRSQVAWDQQHLTSPLETLIASYRRTRDQQLQGNIDLRSLQFLIAALGVVASIAAWRVLPISYALFATVTWMVVLSTGSTVSVWRHIYLIFPLFIIAAKAGAASEVFDRAYLAFSLILAGLMFTILATGWNLVS
ncbi:MAG: hypothetical protein LC797_19155 [Chloroflexi bacterium]|nr:hypothetical protein [Chloroflexota bacterium]